eukprot:TRINITY_DN22863_c0_g2_i1.p1 TRINITY_DN22863_c0_g2~~TRINITY_DN22863_c0_g2_i1.p1  ORF type:complete len:881 (+),score=173.95 TRINITY_DN22863_c0_g2_i1:32-2644(+)
MAALDTLGDLSDVPMQRRQEVIGVLTNVKQLWSAGCVGSISELRTWISQMERLSGFSREVCKQLCLAMSRCLAADREGSPSRIDMQQAFVRMGGVRHTCNMMMLRLADEVIVSHVVNLLTAAVQNSPLAAEAFQRDGRNNLKLVLRSIERHRKCWEVAEAGCKLIGHICSCTSSDKGDHMPVRTKAHRDCQRFLTREGAMDMAVDIIEAYIDDVKQAANKAGMLMQEKIKEAETKTKQSDEVMLGNPKLSDKLPGMGGKRLGLKERIMKVQANLEIRQAWQKVIDKELVAGKVQEAALQALNLLIVGNADTARQLAGTLWVQHMNSVLDVGESFLGMAQKQAADTQKAKKAAKDQKKGLRSALADAEGSDSESSDAGPIASRKRKKEKNVEVPQGESRKAMTSLETLSHKLHISVDVLRGRAAKDKPSLAVKACVLASTILQHHRTLLERTNQRCEQKCKETAFKLGASYREEDREVLTPFGHIFTAIAAVVSIIRTHIENSSVITAAMRVLAQLRTSALLSVPAGMQVRGAPAVKAFQALLIEAGGNDVEWLMRQAARRLVQAARTSEQGDHRMALLGALPADLEGNGEWLTPRMRRDADRSRVFAETLAGDALKGSWAQGGEPGRWEQVLARRQKLAEEDRLRGELRQATEMGMDLEEYRSHVAATALTELKNDTSSQGSNSQVDDVGVEDPDIPNFEEENLYGEQEWVRAVGFGVHDDEDFDRVWKKPITDAIMRCLPPQAPPGSKWALDAEKKRQKLIEAAAALGVPVDDFIDELLVVEMLESVQGKLRIRATVRPQDKIQRNVIDMRGNALTLPENTSKMVTCEVAKKLTKNGYLLPKFGLSVKLTKRSESAPSLQATKRLTRVC